MANDARSVSITRVSGAKREKKNIPELSESDVANLKSIGVAEGQDMFHCLYLTRHARNFFERVVGYRILGPSPYGISVQFFEKK